MTILEEYDEFEGRDGTQYYFVRLIKERILAWKPTQTASYNNEAVCLGVSVHDVDPKELKRLDIWKDLPKETQTAVTQAVNKEKEENVNRMAHARRGRKKKYDFSGLPEMLTCPCGNTVKANYYALRKKATEQCVPLDDLIKAYKCRSCKAAEKKAKEAKNKS